MATSIVTVIEETVVVRVHSAFIPDAQKGRRLRDHRDEQAVEPHDVAFRGLDDDLEIGLYLSTEKGLSVTFGEMALE
jgi:hypothetical protein